MKFFQRLTAAICIGLMGASVSVNAAEGKFLADRHVAKGLPCTSCHVKDGSAELKIDDQKHEAVLGVMDGMTLSPKGPNRRILKK